MSSALLSSTRTSARREGTTHSGSKLAFRTSDRLTVTPYCTGPGCRAPRCHQRPRRRAAGPAAGAGGTHIAPTLAQGVLEAPAPPQVSEQVAGADLVVRVAPHRLDP